jgi:Chorismate mutase
MTDTKELREMISSIDQEIIELIATRMEIADELALAKKSSSQEFWDVKVEKEIIGRYKKLCEEVALSEDEAEKIAVLILNISRERQRHFFE